MMAVTGALIVLSRLPSDKNDFSRSFASFDITKTMRPGLILALVGPQRMRSYTAMSRAGLTGLSSHLFWVRALRKITSRASSLTACDMASSKCDFVKLETIPIPGNRGRLNRFDGVHFRNEVAKHILDAVFERHRRGRAPGA